MFSFTAFWNQSIQLSMVCFFFLRKIPYNDESRQRNVWFEMIWLCENATDMRINMIVVWWWRMALAACDFKRKFFMCLILCHSESFESRQQKCRVFFQHKIFYSAQNIWLVTSLIDSDAKKKLYEGELNGSDHIFKCQITFIFMTQKERQFILNLLSTVFYAIWTVPSDFLLFNEFILNSAFQQSVLFMFIRFVIFRFNPIHWYLCTHDEHRVTQSEHIYSIPVSIHCSHDVIHYSFHSKFKHKCSGDICINTTKP